MGGDRGKWRGKGEHGGEHEFSRRSSWVKDGKTEHRKVVFIEGDNMGLVRKETLGKFPGTHMDDPS